MYIKLLHFIISLFDMQNKIQIINFFKNNFLKMLKCKMKFRKTLNTFIVIDLSKFNL